MINPQREAERMEEEREEIETMRKDYEILRKALQYICNEGQKSKGGNALSDRMALMARKALEATR